MPKFIEKTLDVERKFRLNLAAQQRIEKKFKKPFAKINHEELTIEDFSFIIFATLSDEDRKEIATSEKLIEILDEYMSLGDIQKLFIEIVEEAFGKNAQRTAEELPEVEDPEENGTGMKQFQTLSDVE
jgi:uncharacterized glyoxalase superfamily protein PhnB